VDRPGVEAVRAALDRYGVQYLAVSENPRNDGELVVYLDGYAGHTQQTEAIRILGQLAGVQNVAVSAVSWTILVITVAPDEVEER